MIRNQLTVAIRNFRKNRFFSMINIIGMTIGLTTILVISDWVHYELSFDKFHMNSGRIYRFTVEVQNENGYQSHFARCWQSWTREMPAHFPQISRMAFLAPMRRTAIKKDLIKFNSNQVFRINPDAFGVFDIRITQGNISTTLDHPNKLLISERIYQRFFDGENLTGQRLELAGAYETEFRDYEIAGIFKDFPPNSHFHPEILVAYDNPGSYEGWAYIYFLLKEGTAPLNILNNFPEFIKNYESEDVISSLTPHLQPIQQIHLYSRKDREIEKNGDIHVIWLFISVALVILILSLINFIQFNLSLLIGRKNQFAIQKILGGSFYQYSVSIIIETLMVLVISFILSTFFFLFIKSALRELIPLFNLSMITSLITTGMILFILCSLLVIIPQLLLVSGSIFFPMHLFGMSGRSEINTLKSYKYRNQKGLVILQFTLSIILISGSLYIYNQNKYLFSQRMGENIGPVVVIPELNWSMKEKNFEFKSQLLSSHLIKNVTGSMEPPSGYVMDAMDFEMEGYEDQNTESSIYVFPVDDNFLDFYKIPILSGEDFSPYDPDMEKEDYIINETAMKFLGFDDPDEVIGRKFKLNFYIDTIFHGGTVRAVVRDFNLSPLHEKIKPLVMFQKPIWYGTMLIEIDARFVEESLSFIHSTWEKLYPDYYLDYHFSDELYQDAYQNEIIQSKLSGILTVLSIIVASLGLLGLSILMTQIRAKEITIRKVNGAISGDIFIMLSADFLKWVLLAFLIAVPTGWYIILKWSENYPYRVDISWWIFILAGSLAVLSAWISISYHTYRAAGKNPAESLRNE